MPQKNSVSNSQGVSEKPRMLSPAEQEALRLEHMTAIQEMRQWLQDNEVKSLNDWKALLPAENSHSD